MSVLQIKNLTVGVLVPARIYFMCFPPSSEDKVWTGARKAEENWRTPSGTRSASSQDIFSGQLAAFYLRPYRSMRRVVMFLLFSSDSDKGAWWARDPTRTDCRHRWPKETLRWHKDVWMQLFYFSAIFHLAQWNARHLPLFFLSVYMQSCRGSWRKSKTSCSPRLKTQRERFQTTI